MAQEARSRDVLTRVKVLKTRQLELMSDSKLSEKDAKAQAEEELHAGKLEVCGC